jgi:hypothetical protein
LKLKNRLRNEWVGTKALAKMQKTIPPPPKNQSVGYIFCFALLPLFCFAALSKSSSLRSQNHKTLKPQTMLRYAQLQKQSFAALSKGFARFAHYTKASIVKLKTLKS